MKNLLRMDGLPSTSLNQRLFKIANGIPLCDFAAVLVAAYISSLLATALTSLPAGIGETLARSRLDSLFAQENLSLIGASTATYILYDQNFITRGPHRLGAWIFAYILRLAATVAIVSTIGHFTHLFDTVDLHWLLLWFAGAALFTASSRCVAVLRMQKVLAKNSIRESKRTTQAQVGESNGADALALGPAAANH